MSHKKIYSRSGVFAWSGVGAEDAGVVIADAAQQIDFSRAASTTTLDYVSMGSIQRTAISRCIAPDHSCTVDFKFNDIAWSAFRSEEHPSGLIIGGGEGGVVSVLDANSLIQAGTMSRIGTSRYHEGHVFSVDVSQVNPKWVCTGGAKGVVLLWDMNHPLQAMCTGTPNFDHQVKCVSWNRRVEPILASLTGERCSIWDLRASGSPILDIGDYLIQGSGVLWSVVKWSAHYETFLSVVSQNDSNPVTQLWDLRNASIPIISYTLHTKGILGMDWSAYDRRLMATAGRDEVVIFQDVDSGTAIGQVPVRGYPRRISFCNTNANVFAVSYFDRPIEFFSLTPFSASEVKEEEAVTLRVVSEWMRAGSSGSHVADDLNMCSFEQASIGTRPAAISQLNFWRASSNTAKRHFVSMVQEASEAQLLSFCCEKIAGERTNPDLKTLWTFLHARSSNSSRKDYLDALIKLNVAPSYIQAESLVDRFGELSGGDGASQRDFEADDEEDGEDDNADDYSAYVPFEVGPTLPQLMPECDFGHCMGMICANKPQAAIQEANSKNLWLTSLLLSISMGDYKSVRSTAVEIANDATMDHTTRTIAMICAGSWRSLLLSFGRDHWSTALCLILSMAPPHKVRRLCSEVSESMLRDGEGILAAVPAIIGDDVERLMKATLDYVSLDERVALAVALRHAIGGGSSRAVAPGPTFLEALERFARFLARNSDVQLAWKIVEPVEASYCSESLNEFRYYLYFATGENFNRSAKVCLPGCPFSDYRKQFSTLGNTTTAAGAFQPQAASIISRRHPSSTGRAPKQFSPHISPTEPRFQSAPSGAVATKLPAPAVYPAFAPIQYYGGYPSTGNVGGYGSYSQNGHRSQTHAAGNSSFVEPAIPPPPAGAYGSLQQGHLSSSQVIGSRRSSTTMAQRSPHSPSFVTQPCVPEFTWSSPVSDPVAGESANIANIRAEAEQAGQQVAVLSSEDDALVNSILKFADDVRAINPTRAVHLKSAKLEEVIRTELKPRLANSKFAMNTLKLLRELGRCLERRDFCSCLAICGDLANGHDFSELSPIMPALKVLIITARDEIKAGL